MSFVCHKCLAKYPHAHEALACADGRHVPAEPFREAVEMLEDCMQYVSPFLIQKWGYDDDLTRLKALLIDGNGAENRGSTS